MKTQTNTGYIVFLSVVAAIGGILFGYDTAVISGTIAGVATQFRDGSSAARGSARSPAWPSPAR